MARQITEKVDFISPLLTLFCEFGIDGLTLTELSKRMSLGKGSIYYFFPNGKADMLEYILIDTESFIRQNIFALLEKRERPEQIIIDFFDFLLNENRSTSYFHFISILVLSRQNQENQVYARIYFNDFTHKLAKLYSKLGYSNSKSWNIAENVVVSIYGSFLLSSSERSSKIFKNRMSKLKKIVLENLKKPSSF